MSAAPTRTSKRKAKTPSDISNGAASTTTATTAPSRSTASILTPGPPSASTSASIPSSLHQSAFSIPVRASSPQSSQSQSQSQSLAPTLPQLPLATSVFAATTPPSAAVSSVDSKEQTDDESDSPDSNAVDDSQQHRTKKAKTEQPAAASDNLAGSASTLATSASTPSASPTSTAKKQPEPELSDAAKHVLFERRWSPQYSSDWSSSSALSLHLSWQKLIDQLQQQFGVRWTKKKLADAADHAKKVYVDRRKAARLPGQRTPQPWKWHQLMEQWLGQQMSDQVKDEPDQQNQANSNAATQPSLLPPPPAVPDASKTGGRGPAPPLPGTGSASSAAGGGQSSAMDGALNHALYALVQDSQRRHEEQARAHSEKLDRLLALMQTVVDRVPAPKTE